MSSASDFNVASSDTTPTPIPISGLQSQFVNHDRSRNRLNVAATSRRYLTRDDSSNTETMVLNEVSNPITSTSSHRSLQEVGSADLSNSELSINSSSGFSDSGYNVHSPCSRRIHANMHSKNKPLFNSASDSVSVGHAGGQAGRLPYRNSAAGLSLNDKDSHGGSFMGPDSSCSTSQSVSMLSG